MSSQASGAASEVLGSWLAREREVLAALENGSGNGFTRPQDAAHLTGLQMMQGMLSGQYPNARIQQTLDFLPVEITEGYAVFQGAPGPNHMNPMGGIHGGWYSTLLDSAMGCAVHTRLPAGRGYTTAELSVNIVRAIGDKAPRVRAEGRVLHCGRQLATAEGRLVGPDGTLYAHATTTCLVFELGR